MLFAKFDINVAADKIVNIKEIMEKDPMSRPYVLKPIEGGSSIDVAIIDKNILRICIYEIKFNELTPSIAMDEAIEIAKIFGSDKSGAFINGVIDSFVQNDKI